MGKEAKVKDILGGLVEELNENIEINWCGIDDHEAYVDSDAEEKAIAEACVKIEALFEDWDCMCPKCGSENIENTYACGNKEEWKCHACGVRFDTKLISVIERIVEEPEQPQLAEVAECTG